MCEGNCWICQNDVLRVQNCSTALWKTQREVSKSCCQTSQSQLRLSLQEKSGGKEAEDNARGGEISSLARIINFTMPQNGAGLSQKSGTHQPLRSNLLNKSHPWHSLSTCHLSLCPPCHASHSFLCSLSPDSIKKKSGWLGRERYF